MCKGNGRYALSVGRVKGIQGHGIFQPNFKGKMGRPDDVQQSQIPASRFREVICRALWVKSNMQWRSWKTRDDGNK